MKKNIYVLLSFISFSLSAQQTPQDTIKKLDEVVVAASRIEESIFATPISVAKINALAIQNSASTEIISLLANQKVLM